MVQDDPYLKPDQKFWIPKPEYNFRVTNDKTQTYFRFEAMVSKLPEIILAHVDNLVTKPQTLRGSKLWPSILLLSNGTRHLSGSSTPGITSHWLQSKILDMINYHQR
jgi:hypothetical protein